MVVVAFKDERIATIQRTLDMRCDAAGVGQNPESMVAIADDELGRLTRIVGYGQRHDLQIVKREYRMLIEEFGTFETYLSAARQRAWRTPDRDIITSGKPYYTIYMIRMFMGDQNGGDIFRGNFKSRETRRGLRH